MNVEATHQIGGFGPAMPLGGGLGGVRQAAMDAAAGVLGMERDELRSRVSSGASLADLAAERDVSTDDLKAAMSEAITGSAPPEIAGRIIARLDDRLDGGSGVGERSGFGLRGLRDTAGMSGAVDALASALDMSTDALLSSLEDGTFRERLGLAADSAGPGLLVDEDA